MNIKNLLLVIGLSAGIATSLSAGSDVIVANTAALKSKAVEALAAAQKVAGEAAGFTVKKVAVYKDVTVVFLEKNKYGVAAIASITVAGALCVYALYESGAWVEVADYSMRHPYRVASSVVAAAGLAGLAVFAYKNNFDTTLMKAKVAAVLASISQTCAATSEKLGVKILSFAK